MRTNVTSSSTLFWKFAVPTLWITIVGTFAIGLAFSDIQPAAASRGAAMTLLFSSLFLAVVLAWLTVFRLKRVELDEEFMYVTNYFKWYKYPYLNVERIVERDWVLVKVVSIELREKGRFGRQITFLANTRALDEFLKKHPGVARALSEEGV